MRTRNYQNGKCYQLCSKLNHCNAAMDMHFNHNAFEVGSFQIKTGCK